MPGSAGSGERFWDDVAVAPVSALAVAAGSFNLATFVGLSVGCGWLCAKPRCTGRLAPNITKKVAIAVFLNDGVFMISTSNPFLKSNVAT